MTKDELIAEGLSLVHPNQGQARLLDPSEGRNIRKYLEDAVGGRTGGNMYCVVARDGKEITRHDHPEDVVLFYPQPDGTPVILEHEGTVDNPGPETVIPLEPGDTAFVPKRVWHRVPAHNGEVPRVSIALKLED